MGDHHPSQTRRTVIRLPAFVWAKPKSPIGAYLFAISAYLLGIAGLGLLRELDIPEPWRGHVDASVVPIDDLELRISEIESELRRTGADHRYLPLLMTAPGIGWITGFTIAAEIGDIARFSSPVKLTGYTGLCPRVKQSGDMDQRGPVSKHGPAICAGS